MLAFANADVDAVRVILKLQDVERTVAAVVLAVRHPDKVDEAGRLADDDEIPLAGDRRDDAVREDELAVLKRSFGAGEELRRVGDLGAVIDANGVSECGERVRLGGSLGHDPERMMDKKQNMVCKKITGKRTAFIPEDVGSRLSGFNNLSNDWTYPTFVYFPRDITPGFYLP